MDLIPFLSEAKPRGTVLLAHGFGEYHGRYTDFITALNDAEYDVWAFDFPGHGTTPGKPATVDVGRLIGLHLQARRELMGLTRTQTIFLFGHSMGGLVTLASSLIDPTHITATALTGPALRPQPSTPLPLAKIGYRAGKLFPGLKTIQIDHTKLSHDLAMVEKYADDPLVFEGKVPLLTGASMMIQGANVIKNAPMLAVSTLILHGNKDVLADTSGSIAFAEKAGDLVELKIKDGEYHELLNEIDRQQTTEEIIEWYGQW